MADTESKQERESFVPLGHFGCAYDVHAQPLSSLPPVQLTVFMGPCRFQDYLSPDEADLLAGMLRAGALEVRRLKQVRSDMDVVAAAARTRYEPPRAA